MRHVAAAAVGAAVAAASVAAQMEAGVAVFFGAAFVVAAEEMAVQFKSVTA